MRWVELNWFYDAELLRHIGRGPFASILEMLGPFLAGGHFPLPDPGLPDSLYFAELAAIFRCQPIKVVAYLPPFLAGGSRRLESPQPEARPRAQTPSSSIRSRRGGDIWYFADFAGNQAILKHEQGICYAAGGASRPGERVKKLSLAAEALPVQVQRSQHIEVYDPATGKYNTRQHGSGPRGVSCHR